MVVPVLNMLLGLGVGVLVTWLVLRARLNVVSEKLSICETNLGMTQTNFADQQRANLELNREVSSLQATVEHARVAAEEKLELLNSAKQALEDTFKALAARALESNNASFLELAKENLGGFQSQAKADLEARKKAVEDLIKPIGDSLIKVDDKLGTLETERVGAYAGLKGQVESLLSMQKELSNETANLVRALRSPVVRGRWGEIQLRRVVELAGMLSHCDFVEQETLSTEGGRLRPDLIVKLPGGKQVIVDSKTPLEAYLDSVNTGEDEERRVHLQRHAVQVRTHLAKLGSKSYWDQFACTPEFVVMFLPGEAFFSAALEQQPGLIEEGVDQKVIPASPTTLIALLRAVAFGWRQEKLARNAEDISKLGRDLYDRLRKVAEHFGKLGKGLSGAVDAYNSAMSSFESRVLVSARRFTELGASVAGDIPEAQQIESVTRTLPIEWEEFDTLSVESLPPTDKASGSGQEQLGPDTAPGETLPLIDKASA